MADAVVPQPVALFKKRTAKASTRKRPRVAASSQRSDVSESEEYSSADEITGARQIKRRRKAGVPATQTTATPAGFDTSLDLKTNGFSGTNSTTITNTNDATKTSDWYDDAAASPLSSRDLLGKTRYGQPGRPSKSHHEASDGTYRGAAAYTSHIQKSQNALEKTSSVGPIKAPPTNIRTITVTDFAPDVCKDYKQTGFCGFGDSCKFLHAREDYKQGWELDKAWEKVNTGKKPIGGTVVSRADRSAKLGGESDEDEDALLEGIPFACIICKESYKSPIVTKCGHYFCEKCALGRYRKNPNCAACGAGTNGVFNAAKGLTKILDRKRDKAAKRRQQAVENGEQISSDEEDVIP